MSWKDQAVIHAEAKAPKESCGLLALIKGKETYWPCKNLAETASEYFVINPDDWADCEDEGELIGIVHSHPFGAAVPSEPDKASCEHLGLPWFIYSVQHKDWVSFEPSGYEAGIYGRRWIWGKHDCWSLITDFFKQEKNINIPYTPRPKNIKEFSKNPLFEATLPKLGFKEIHKNEIKPYDVLLVEGPEKKLSHTALYIGDQTILHHNIGQLSCRENYDLKYIEATKKVYRYGT